MKKIKLDEQECIICENITYIDNKRKIGIDSIDEILNFKNAIIANNKAIESMDYDDLKLYYELLPHQNLKIICIETLILGIKEISYHLVNFIPDENFPTYNYIMKCNIRTIYENICTI